MKYDRNTISTQIIMSLIFLICSCFLSAQNERKIIVEFDSTVKLKIFDVLLLNSEGMPIKGLNKNKFKLFIDGDKVDIDTFDMVDYKDPKSNLAPSISHEPNSNPIEDYIQQDGLGDKHLFILLFHNLPRNKELRKEIAEIIVGIFENSKNPRDYFAVYFFSGEKITLLLPFTNDTEQLRNVVTDLYIENKLKLFPILPTFHDNNTLLRKAFVRKPDRAMASIGNVDFDNQINQAANVLDILIRSLGSFKGRKEIFIFSDSLNLLSTQSDVFGKGKRGIEYDRMILDARNQNIAINTFDMTKMSGFDISGSGGADYLLRELDNEPLSYLLTMGIIKKFRGEMRTTASKTGGMHIDKAYSGDATRKGIENIYERSSSVYFLGIYLNKYKFDDGKEHQVEIEVDTDDAEAIYQPSFRIEPNYKRMDEVDRLSQFMDAFYGAKDFKTLKITDAFLHFPYGDNGNLLVSVFDMPVTPDSGNKHIVAVRYYNVKTMTEKQVIKTWDLSEQKENVNANAARFMIAVPVPTGQYVYHYAVRDEENGLMNNREYSADIDSGKSMLSSTAVFGNTTPYINFTNVLDKNVTDKRTKSDSSKYLVNPSLNPFNYDGRLLAPLFGDPLLRSADGFVMFMYNQSAITRSGYSLSWTLTAEDGKDFTNLLIPAEDEKEFPGGWWRVTLKFIITVKNNLENEVETENTMARIE